jgi:fucose 4-O-acetylase-like acetyltransferase
MTAASSKTLTPPATNRVPLWDNARFLCMLLVVIGHSIQRLTIESDSALIVYLVIFSFHMPAFAIISGYFTRSSPPTALQMKKVLLDILLPYLIMEIIWSTIVSLEAGRLVFNPTQANWTLWFLLALAIFRLVLPYLALLRWPLLWAVALSLGVGFFANVDSTFSLSRAIGILPFFVLGWKVREWNLFERWNSAVRAVVWLRSAAVTVIAVWIAVVIVFIGEFRAITVQQWFFYDASYSEIGDVHWWSAPTRLGFMVLAVVLSAAFLALIPRGETWFTTFGKATMYIYLLHTFAIYPIRQSGILQSTPFPDLWLIGMITFAVIITFALASPLVQRVFRPIIEPKPRWPFVKEMR